MIAQWLKSHLVRDTSSGAFIPQIDGLRFVAIGSVIAYHVADFVRTKTGHEWNDSAFVLLLSHGYFGVPLFFVISGFVISLPFVQRAMSSKPPPSLKRYFLRRLTRLEPPYLINLLLLFGLLLIFKDQSAQELWPHLLASMSYTHNAIFNEFSHVNFLAWSLEVEFQFYALAPLLVLVFRVRRLAIRRCLLLSLILLFGLTANRLDESALLPRLMLIYYLSYFFAGFLFADIYVNDWKQHPTSRLVFDLVSIFSWGALIFCLYEPDRYRMILPLLILSAYWGAFRGKVSNWFFSRPLIFIIGGMCYTLYLYHFYVVSFVGKIVLPRVSRLTDDLTAMTVLMLLFATPVVLLTGTILFAFFEKPFMRRSWFEEFMSWFNRTFSPSKSP